MVRNVGLEPTRHIDTRSLVMPVFQFQQSRIMSVGFLFGLKPILRPPTLSRPQPFLHLVDRQYQLVEYALNGLVTHYSYILRDNCSPVDFLSPNSTKSRRLLVSTWARYHSHSVLLPILATALWRPCCVDSKYFLGLSPMAGMEGLEPPQHRLTVYRSTNWTTLPYKKEICLLQPDTFSL